jgi:MoaA/NifB/PqqE/SkfB family radical SAM enzyme
MRSLWYHQAKVKLSLRYRFQNVSIAFRKNLNKPTYLCLKISERCNAQCRHCDVWKLGIQSQEMTTAQLQKLLLQLKKWLGPFSLHITGGEPLLREDLIDILAYSNQHQIFVELLTNGWLLVETKAEQIVNAGVNQVTISLDGINPVTHDMMRGKSGFYTHVNNAIDFLMKYQEKYHSSILLVIKTVINRNNLDELVPIVDWVKKKGITGVIYQPIEQNYGEPINPDWYKSSKLWVSDLAKLIKIMETLYELKINGAPILNKSSDFNLIKEYFKHPERLMKQVQQHTDRITPQACYNGVSNFVISSNGDVRMCFQMNPIGNVTQQRPEQIWKDRSVCWKKNCPY